MKKVLVWDKNFPLNNCGGPSGYMWNIKTFMEETESPYREQVQFYSDVLDGRHGILDKLHKYICSALSKIGCGFLSTAIRIFYPYGRLSKNEIDVLKEFDYIHFHTLPSMLAYGRKVNKLGIKTIYTSHSPELMTLECLNKFPFAKRIIGGASSLKNILVHRELKAYKEASYIMFPVSDVLECYLSGEACITEFFSKTNKIFFTPTAIKDELNTVNKGILAKYNLPQNSIKLCYVGRHNVVKGYEYLKEIASIIFTKRDDVYFIIGGKQDNSVPLNHANWIELGWVNTKELLNEVDAFILPNQQTYFDIIALEVMRSGTPLITTYTGGNKYFGTIENNPIVFFSNSDAEKASETIIDFIVKDMKGVGSKCRDMYKKYFTIDCYLERYTNSINKLD